MNTDKLEVKLMALVVSCRTMESQEEIGNQIMQCADDIVKNCSIPAVVGRSEQFYCTCSRAKGLDHDEEGTPYCISCQKEVQ